MTTQQRAEAFKVEWKAECWRRGCGYATAGSIPDVAEEREACPRLADEESQRRGASSGRDAARRIAGAIGAREGTS